MSHISIENKIQVHEQVILRYFQLSHYTRYWAGLEDQTDVTSTLKCITRLEGRQQIKECGTFYGLDVGSFSSPNCKRPILSLYEGGGHKGLHVNAYTRAEEPPHDFPKHHEGHRRQVTSRWFPFVSSHLS